MRCLVRRLSDLTLNEKVSLLQVSQPAIERVGLPAYNFGRECERGDTSGKLGTAYPTGLALGGTFDVQLVHAIAVATAIEVRGNVNTDNATFGASCFGPCVAHHSLLPSFGFLRV
jgi:beta-glucosidase